MDADAGKDIINGVKKGLQDVHQALANGWEEDSPYKKEYNAGQRRILITHLASAAQASAKKSTIISSFERTGALLLRLAFVLI